MTCYYNDGEPVCLECGHDLRDLPTRGECPECGNSYSWIAGLREMPPGPERSMKLTANRIGVWLADNRPSARSLAIVIFLLCAGGAVMYAGWYAWDYVHTEIAGGNGIKSLGS